MRQFNDLHSVDCTPYTTTIAPPNGPLQQSCTLPAPLFATRRCSIISLLCGKLAVQLQNLGRFGCVTDGVPLASE